MKNERQEKILAIIAASAIETQEQLIDSLRKEGISCTQATISRDIKQLHLIKEPTGNGTYRYAVSTQKMRLNLADRLQTIRTEDQVHAFEHRSGSLLGNSKRRSFGERRDAAHRHGCRRAGNLHARVLCRVHDGNGVFRVPGGNNELSAFHLKRHALAIQQA